MAACLHCHKKSLFISSPVSLCANCIRKHFKDIKPIVDKIHSNIRSRFNLPPSPPKDSEGLLCPLCTNQCQVAEGGRGACGVRSNRNGRWFGGGIHQGNFSSYYDTLPTNCVADWVCPGGSRSGYPGFSHSKGAEYGYKNLAVFFNSCTFNCLFCQNWHYREASTLLGKAGPEAIADRVDDRTSCICYFGGDPSSQILYAIKASKEARKKAKGKILRICWETNGSMNPKILEKAAELSLESGGCLKFDLKTWDENLHKALCGVSNHQTLSNFKLMAKHPRIRPDPPFLVASTLLIPGYVDEEEVRNIARFIADLDPDIPYSLLGFYPHFYMQDLPTTSRSHAERCQKTAQEQGLKRVRVGNIHLLSNAHK